MWRRALLRSCAGPRPSARQLHIGAVRRDGQKQPTGRAGAISPWIRTPFLEDRGPAPGVDLSLQERLDQLSTQETAGRGERVDIGFRREGGRGGRDEARSRTAEWRRRVRTDPALERAARDGTLQVDMEVVRQQWVESGQSFDDIYEAAELYGIYEDLFGSAFFRPCVPLGVEWAQAGGERQVPAHRGNLVKPAECTAAPRVSWSGPETALWTLAMVGPDSHLSQPDAEVLHWLVGNIRGSDLATGDTLATYLQPHPPLGTGYHRFVFLLFRQEGPVELEQERRAGPADLAERTFSTLDFYRGLQDHLTPAGLAFCQADYDPSLRGFYHNTLAMKEPRYEYEFPEHYVRPWKKFFPDQERVGFDEFLDRHRDPKDVERQVLEKKLANTSPFTGDRDADLKFPGLHDSDLQEQFPPPVGEKRLNPKQSFKIAQWRRNAVMRERRKEGYFATYDHKALRQDPSTCS